MKYNVDSGIQKRSTATFWLGIFLLTILSFFIGSIVGLTWALGHML